MSQPAFLLRPTEPAPLDVALPGDDRLGYDAWLLPPAAPSAWESAIRRCSIAAGPIAFAGGLALFLRWLV